MMYMYNFTYVIINCICIYHYNYSNDIHVRLLIFTCCVIQTPKPLIKSINVKNNYDCCKMLAKTKNSIKMIIVYYT